MGCGGFPGGGGSAAINPLDFGCGNNTFKDDFTTVKPFWYGYPSFDNGDWDIDTTDERMEGVAENLTNQVLRGGIEGDFDYIFDFERNSATSESISITDGTNTAELQLNAGDSSGTKIVYSYTGETTLTPVNNDANDRWLLRIRRVGTQVSAYYIDNTAGNAIASYDASDWTLIATYDDLFGHVADLLLDSANTAYIWEVSFCDNMFPARNRSQFPKLAPLTDAATIAVDASLGNFFTVELAGNRTLGAPTNPRPNQMICFRVRQDGTGSRTLAYNAIYRFSSDLPSPTLTTAPGDVDYLLFCYDETDDKWDFVGKVFGFAS